MNNNIDAFRTQYKTRVPELDDDIKEKEYKLDIELKNRHLRKDTPLSPTQLYRGNKTFFLENAPKCRLLCSRCISKSKKTNERCKLTTCQGVPYCHNHLSSELHLRILPSTYGKGLFASDRKKGENEIIFEKGDEICTYIGEILSIDQLDNRYSVDTQEAPYTALVSLNKKDVINIQRNNPIFYKKVVQKNLLTQQKSNYYLDSACIRGVGSYANHKPQKEANAQLTLVYYSDNEYGDIPPHVVIIAKKNIKNNEEIFITYDNNFVSNTEHTTKDYNFSKSNSSNRNQPFFDEDFNTTKLLSYI